MEEKVVVSIRDVYKKFGGKAVHDGLSLDVFEGEILTLAGRSGEGKSLLIKMIIGLLRPDSGHIYVFDKDVIRMKERELIKFRRRVGLVFQSAALFDNMNVFDNIAFPLRQHLKLSKEAMQQRVAEKLEMVDLNGIEDMMPVELSGGMKKRVGLARAIATNPDILLYDEPTTGLDPTTSNHITKLIKKLQKELRATSIMVTHDMHSVRDITDRMSLLWKGKILASGSWQEMMQSDEPIVRNFMSGEDHSSSDVAEESLERD